MALMCYNKHLKYAALPSYNGKPTSPLLVHVSGSVERMTYGIVCRENVEAT